MASNTSVVQLKAWQIKYLFKNVCIPSKRGDLYKT